MNELIEQQRWLDRRLNEILEAADYNMAQVSIPDIHTLATSHFASYGECMDELKRVHGIAKLKAVGSAEKVQQAQDALDEIEETHEEKIQSIEAQIERLAQQLKEQEQIHRQASGNLLKAQRANEQLMDTSNLPPVIKSLLQQSSKQSTARFGKEIQDAEKKLHRAELIAKKLDTNPVDLQMLPESRGFLKRVAGRKELTFDLPAWREYVKQVRKQIPTLQESYDFIVQARNEWERQNIQPLKAYHDEGAYTYVNERNDG